MPGIFRLSDLPDQEQGLLGFTAEVLAGNDPVFRLIKKMGFDVSRRNEEGVYEMKAMFR